MPSRRAQGQISSSVDAEEVHRRLRDQRARQQLVGAALGDAGQPGTLAGGHGGELRHPLLQRGAAQPALHVQALGGAAPRPRSGRAA